MAARYSEPWPDRRRDLVALIGRTLDSVGRTAATVVTGFTDGCAGLRLILAAAGVAEPAILDWFHIAMRLQHFEQTAGAAGGEGGDRDGGRPATLASVA